MTAATPAAAIQRYSIRDDRDIVSSNLFNSINKNYDFYRAVQSVRIEPRTSALIMTRPASAAPARAADIDR